MAKPRAFPRLFRWIPVLVLVAAFLVTQALLRGPDAALARARVALAPFVLIAAASAGPLLLPQPAATPGQTIIAIILALVTVVAVLLAIPLWYGHGCWAPDLYAFLGYLACGAALALFTPFSLRRLQNLPEGRRNQLAGFFLLGFVLAGAFSFAAPRPQQGAVLPGNRPQVLWSVTPWQGTWADLAPRPWSRSAYAPADPAVGEGLVVFLDLPGRLLLLNASDGSRRLSVELEAGQLLPGDTAKYRWERPLLATGHVLLQQRGSSDRVFILDLGRETLRTVAVRDAYAVAPDPRGGFYTYSLDSVSRVDWQGNLLWSSKPSLPQEAGVVEQFNFSVNPFSPPELSPWFVPSPDGLFCLHPQALYYCDPETGKVKWQKSPRGRFAGMQVSPGKEAVYVLDAAADGKEIVAYSASGTQLWSWQTPPECHSLTWAAGPSGLLVAFRTAGAVGTAAEYVGLDGMTKYTLPVFSEEPFSFQYKGGLFLVAGTSVVRAYRAEDGQLLWALTKPGQTSPGHYRYYEDFLAWRNKIIIPLDTGLGAYDSSTGKEEWFYTPPGGLLGFAGDAERLYVCSRRGIFALKE